MRKISGIFCLVGFVSLILIGFLVSIAPKVSVVLAKDDRKYSDDEIPEKDGDYALRDHPGVRVRVFVHKEKDLAKRQDALTACSVSDPDSTAVVGSTGWHLASNWTYQLNVNSVPSSVGGSNLPVIAGESFLKWSTVSGDLVSFSRGADTRANRARYDGQNVIAWGRASAGTLGVTYTWYYLNGGQAVETDTILNLKYSWSWTTYSETACANPNTYDAYDILIHELGHWMGLDDHYSAEYVDNTMYGYGSKGEIKKDTLTSGDVAGAQNIY